MLQPPYWGLRCYNQVMTTYTGGPPPGPKPIPGDKSVEVPICIHLTSGDRHAGQIRAIANEPAGQGVYFQVWDQDSSRTIAYFHTTDNTDAVRLALTILDGLPEATNNYGPEA